MSEPTELTEPTIHGPLYIEQMGPSDAPTMVFVHPNPMDSACWLFQMAHLSTWFRCVAVDLPGYGRSPSADDGITMRQIAAACWDAVDRVATGPAVLVGCSVGSNVVQHMYHLRPDATAAVVLSGTGYAEVKSFQRRIDAYQEQGLDYRYDYTLQDLSPTFRETPLARWLAELFQERNATACLDTIVAMFRALGVTDPPWLAGELHAPVLILTGSEDSAHPRAFALRDRLPDAELVTLEGAGHACNIEQPWEFDRQLLSFLERRGIARALGVVTAAADGGPVGASDATVG